MKYRKFKQNKLWRDKSIQINENMGSNVHWHRLNDEEFAIQLRAKFLEEAQEVSNARDKQELISELADILEVIDSLGDFHGFSYADIIEIKKQKIEKRGGFKERCFVTVVEHADGSWGANYCLAEPLKYPEIKE